MSILTKSSQVTVDAAARQRHQYWFHSGCISLATCAFVCSLAGCQPSGPSPAVNLPATTIDTDWRISQGAPANATDPAGNVGIEASLSEHVLVLGAPVEVAVAFNIKRGSYLYGAVPPSIPFTPLSVQGEVDTSSVTVGEAVLPATSETEDGKPVYRDSFTATLPLQLASPDSGKYLLTIRIKFQVCNDLACLPPEEVVMQLPLLVERSTSL
jgi:hypothetical protein